MLSFDLSEEQQMIRDTVGAFAREQIRPAARAAHEGRDSSRAGHPGLATGSGAGPNSGSLGGNGDTRLATTGAIIAEGFAYGDLAIASHVLAPRLLAFPVLDPDATASAFRPRCRRPHRGRREHRRSPSMVTVPLRQSRYARLP